ncbi:Glutathione-regulated potassium-efflux system protein [Saliniradius amylolyticus]|uniref:Glutathione-regulated potassium-efflux system protein n=1 Tax=Saliniradius amylolyticus TaxID=2183582 RepID=A0A2S2E4N3_9ALTE|nr:cation:proton antiporter [Saliniradius amylolyticus]AWL12593.1 Glutathione-regulated potassium-efflux system protein [Saliniradius amylolyticus]
MEQNVVNILLLMTVAVLAVWSFRRVQLPPILAYLVTGIIAGPEVLSLFEDVERIHLIAELGIVFLLFTLGLEFSLPKMLAMRNLVFGVGAGQMLLTTAFFTGIALLFGLPLTQSILVGSVVALSSTAIVIKQLSEGGDLNTHRAQMSVSVLLFQDLAVVPLLIVIPLLAGSGGDSLTIAISMAVVKGILVIAILFAVGKWLLPRVFSEVARTRTDELFVLTAILVTLLAAGMTYSFGLSMALGAFLAGMMLSESQYRYQLEADIRPFRDILMGLFFITIGMALPLAPLADNGHWVLLTVAGVMVAKVVLIRIAAWIFKAPKADAWAAGIKLCQLGEFSFVLSSLATTQGLFSQELNAFIVSVGVISMLMTPYLIKNSRRFALNLTQSGPVDDDLLPDAEGKYQDHVLILGFGRVGQSVSRMLSVEEVPYVVIDVDPMRVQESRNAGEPVYYGDCCSKDVLAAVGFDKAKMAIVTFDEHARALRVLNTFQQLNPQLPVVVRTRKDYRMEELYQAGASQVVPEILEGSLMLVSQVLHLSGIPMRRILKRVREERKGRYNHLHGFYPGETTEVNYESQSKLEFLHAVILSADAWAVGKTLGEVNLPGLRVKLKGLRRDNQTLPEPGPDTRLLANDVLVISGKPRRVERAERHMLEGH